MKKTREERNDIERKETRDVDQKRKQKIRKNLTNKKKHITDSIEKKKVLSFKEIQLQQQLEHERQQEVERKRFFRQQRKKFTISNMIVPFNVVLRNNSGKLQNKQPRGKYRKQTYIRTTSDQGPKISLRPKYIQSEEEKRNDAEKEEIIKITEEMYNNNRGRGIYYDLNNKIPLIIHDPRLTIQQKKILLLNQSTKELDPNVYNTSDLELFRKLKLRNLPKIMRELIIEESIVMFLEKNKVYTTKYSSTMKLHPNSLINIMINEQKRDSDNPYKQKMTNMNIISDERLSSEQKGILINSVKFQDCDKSKMQNNEIKRINELYEIYATIPTDQLVLEKKKQTVRDIFLNINLFYNRFSILVQDYKNINVNKKENEDITKKKVNNNNNNKNNKNKNKHKKITTITNQTTKI